MAAKQASYALFPLGHINSGDPGTWPAIKHTSGTLVNIGYRLRNLNMRLKGPTKKEV
jgi:hypothetical protein